MVVGFVSTDVKKKKNKQGKQKKVIQSISEWLDIVWRQRINDFLSHSKWST